MTFENKSKNKKTRYMQIRLESDTFEMINMISKRFKIKKSEIARQSLKRYLTTIENKDQPNPKILFSQNLMKDLFEEVSEEFLKKLAIKSFQNSMSDKKYFEKMHYEQTSEEIPIQYRTDSFIEYINVFINYYLPKNQEYWFEVIDSFTKGKNQVITGEHWMGPKFSLFFKFLMNEFAQWDNYELIREHMVEINDESLKQSKSKITLVYAPNN